jgi:zinc/manganese transport system substrate-binding protein
MNRPLSLFRRCAGVALLWFAASLPGFAQAAERIPVVASFSILGDLVSTLGGERVAVSTLVGPDEDAHVFEPRPQDLKTVAQARLVVLNGLGFEGWMMRLAQAANFKGETLIAAQGITARKMADEDHPGHLATDPHAWQNPRNVEVYAQNIVTALARIDPAGADYYRERGTRYIASLKELDDWAAARFATIPAAKRQIITSHDAFGYLGARYGVRLHAAQGLSTESEPDARGVARLIAQIRQARIKALFVENMSDPKLLERLGRDAGVEPSGRLYADALSTADGPAPTYLAMMRYNVEQLVAGMRKN